MVIRPKYNLGDIVYLKTDCEQNEYIVTGIIVTENGLLYRICTGHETEIECFQLELSKVKNFSKFVN